MRRFEKIQNNLFLSFIIVFIAFSAIILLRPAVLTNEESSYISTFDGLKNSGKLVVRNGYREYKSEELNLYNSSVIDGELSSKHSPLFFYIFLPVYLIFGFAGLIWANVIALILIAILFHRLVTEITGKRDLAIEAVYALILSTFIFEYSLAITPDVINLLLIMTATYMYRLSYTTEKLYILFYVGCLLGIAYGFSYLSVVVPILFIFIILWEKKSIIPRLSMLLLGLIPPLGLISFLNIHRFYTANIFAVSDTQSIFSFMVSPSVVIVVFLIFLSCYYLSCYLRKNGNGDIETNNPPKQRKSLYCFLVCAFLLISVSLILIITNYTEFIKYAENFIGYIFNTSFLNAGDTLNPSQSQAGIIAYNGIIKKSLLQSCSFLIVAFLGPYFLWKTKLLKKDIYLLSAYLIGYPIFVSLFNLHRSEGYNYSGFLGLLPWAIIVLLVMLRLMEISYQMMEVVVVALAFFGLILAFSPDNSILSMIIQVILPTALAIAFLITFILNYKIKHPLLNRVFIYIFLASISLSFSLSFFKDLPVSVMTRFDNVYKNNTVENVVSERGIVFVYGDNSKVLAPVKISKKLKIADYSIDKGKDLFILLNENLKKETKVYLYGENVHPEMMEILRVDYDIKNISNTLIPIYEIKQKHPFSGQNQGPRLTL